MQRLVLALFCVCLASADLFVSHTNPYGAGELQSAYLKIDGSNLTFPLGGWLNVYYPSQPGTYATVLFMTGMDSDVPGGYSDILESSATHGIITVSIQFFPPTFPRDELYAIFLNTSQFILSNLTSFLPPGVVAYVENGISLMGHSAGGKIVVKTLEEACSNFQTAILLDPVDGEDPWHIINDFVIHPPDLVNFKIPTLFVASGLGGVPGHSFLPPCAAFDYGPSRFYNAWQQCSGFVLNATQYGHVDFLDYLLWLGIYETQFCKTTDLINTLDYYRSYVSGAISAFIMSVVQRNCDAMKYITDPASFAPIPEVYAQNNYNGCNLCPQPGCQVVNATKVHRNLHKLNRRH